MEQKYGKTFDFSFELILGKDNLKLFDVPSDGHCLLHACVHSYNELKSKELIYDNFRQQIIDEYNANQNHWSSFYDFDTYNIPFIDSMNKFLINKEYDVGAIDVIPNIIAKILDHNLLIYKVTSDKSFVSFNVTNDFNDWNSKPIIMIVLIGNHYLSLISDKDIILFVINILFIKTISKLILKILALPNPTQKYSQEYSQLTSTYLEETINQTSVIGHSEIEQFMEVQERIKCDGNSVFHDFIKFFFKCIINCYYKIYTVNRPK